MLFYRLKKFGTSELVCLAALIAGLTYGMYYLDIQNPFKFSLSEIGRTNHALFIVWSLFSGFALLLNVPRLYKRTNYKSKLGAWCLALGLLCLVATFCNMSKEPLPYAFHVGTALVFALLCFVSIVLPLLSMLKKKDKRYIILCSIYFALMLADVILLAVFKQMAFYEFAALILSYFVLFFTNFTKVFDPANDEKYQPAAAL